MTTAIIPAAGESSRLGRPKQLVTLQGEALVHRAARVALEAGCTRVVVVEGAVPLRAVLADLKVDVVTCSTWRQGPGASLRAGAESAREDDLLVLLADQHAVSAEHLRALLAAPGELAAAHYAGGLGVPARFCAKFGHVLRELGDGQGAKSWLRAHPESITAVPMPEAELDLDTPGQLAALQD